jgi:hypothetical protein
MNSDYTRALVDAAEKAEESAKAWRIRRDDSRKGKDRDDYLYCDARATEAAEFAARLRAWAKATPAPPPDAGERNDLRTFLTIRREAFTDDPSMLSMIDGMLRHIAQPSPPPPAGGEREAGGTCRDCGSTTAQTFFICDPCWDSVYAGASPTGDAVRAEARAKLQPPPAPQGDDVERLTVEAARAWARWLSHCYVGGGHGLTAELVAVLGRRPSAGESVGALYEAAERAIAALRANGGPR